MKLLRPCILQALLLVFVLSPIVFLPSAAHAQDIRCPNIHAVGTPAEQAARFQAAAEAAAQANPPDPCVSTYLRDVIFSYQNTGSTPPGIEHGVELLRAALAKAEATWGSNDPKLVPFLDGLADELWRPAYGKATEDTGKYWDEAESLVRRAIAIDEKAFGPDDNRVNIPLDYLARISETKDDYSQAEQIHLRMLAIDEKADGPEGTSLLYPLEQLANDYSGETRIAQNNVAKTCNSTANGQDCAAMYTALQNKKNEETEPVLTRALEIRSKSPGPNGQFLLQPLTMLAEFYRSEGKVTEAEDLYRQIADVQAKVGGTTSPDVARTWINLGQMYQRQSDYAQAESYFQLGLGVARQLNTARQSDVTAQGSLLMSALMDLGSLAVDQKKTEEARSYLQQTVDAITSGYNPGEPNQQMALFDLFSPLGAVAGLYAKAGLLDDAQALYLRVLSMEESDAQRKQFYISTLQNYASFLRGWMHQPEEAAKVDEQVKALKEKSASPPAPATAPAQ